MSFTPAILRLANAFAAWRDARKWQRKFLLIPQLSKKLMCTVSFYGYTTNFHIPSLFTVYKDCWNCHIYPSDDTHNVCQHVTTDPEFFGWLQWWIKRSRFLNSYFGIKGPTAKKYNSPFYCLFYLWLPYSYVCLFINVIFSAHMEICPLKLAVYSSWFVTDICTMALFQKPLVHQ